MPRLWQLAAVGLAFGIVAGGSCAKVVDHGPFPGNEAYEIAFVVSAVLGGGALGLFVFRLPRARREAWPGIRQVLLTAGASHALTVATFIGFLFILELPPGRRYPMLPLAVTLLVASAVGSFATLGSAALLLVGVGRRMRNPERLS